MVRFPACSTYLKSPSSVRLRDIEKLSENGRYSANLRRDAIARARRNVFGYAVGMPGEEQLLKPLEGRQRMRWYWPSKYLFQNFHVAQYFQMQALRFAPRTTHPALQKLSEALGLCWLKRRAVRALLQQLDERTFRENTSLQDLYGMYRTLCADDPLPFSVDSSLWEPTRFCWMNMRTEKGDVSCGGSAGEALQLQISGYLSRSKMRDTEGVDDDSGSEDSFVKTLPYTIVRDQFIVREVCDAPPVVRGRSMTRTSMSAKRQAPGELLCTSDSSVEKKFLTAYCSAGRESQVKDVSDPSGRPGREKSEKALVAISEGNTSETLSAKGSVMRNLMTVRIGLTPAPSAALSKAWRQRREKSRRLLLNMLRNDEKLTQYHNTQHRFVDPLFARKRISFLDRFARDRIKGEMARKIGTKLYVLHPDQKETWPDNKGLVTRQWPSPYH